MNNPRHAETLARGSHKPLTKALQTAGLALLLTAGIPVPLTAQSTDPGPIVEFSIPAGELAAALQVFAREAGVNLSYTPEQVEGKTAPALRGSYSVDSGLQRLLSGTHLRAVAEGSGYRIESPGQHNDDGAFVLRPITVEGETESAYGPIEGFRAKRSSAATNVDAPLTETPATVNVITRDFLDTIAARRPEDVLQYVPGATAESQNGTASGFNIRGFASSTQGATATGAFANSIYIDDFRVAGRRYHFDPALYERIDVLKGTASILYGTAAPGGIVRYVTRRPEFESRHRLEATLGSFETTRGTIDSTGPIDEAGTLAYRLIATGLDSNQSFNGRNDDRSFDDRLIVNPQLLWRTPGGGELHLSYEYSNHNNTIDTGIVILPDGSITFNNGPLIGADNFIDRENHIGTITFTQPFAQDWSFELGAAIGRTDIDGLWDSAFAPPGSSLLNRQTRRWKENQDQEELRGKVEGRFNTGANIEHELSIGANYFSSTYENNNGQIFAVGAIDPTNPMFGPAPDVGPLNRFFGQAIEETSVWIHDYVSIGDKLKMFGGLRFIDAESDLTQNDIGGAESGITYSIGAIYNQSPWFNPFASYSTSLTPQTGLLSGSDEAVPFLEGDQIEFGLKSEWFDGSLATNVSLFQIEQTNITEGDPVNPGFVILVGDQRTRGIEFEAVGQVTEQISIIGGYSFLDAEFTAGSNQGNTPHSVPEHKFSLYGNYDFTRACSRKCQYNVAPWS